MLPVYSPESHSLYQDFLISNFFTLLSRSFFYIQTDMEDHRTVLASGSFPDYKHPFGFLF